MAAFREELFPNRLNCLEIENNTLSSLTEKVSGLHSEKNVFQTG
jgi:hypothetical protein